MLQRRKTLSTNSQSYSHNSHMYFTRMQERKLTSNSDHVPRHLHNLHQSPHYTQTIQSYYTLPSPFHSVIRSPVVLLSSHFLVAPVVVATVAGSPAEFEQLQEPVSKSGIHEPQRKSSSLVYLASVECEVTHHGFVMVKLWISKLAAQTAY